jgi:hypothetical protein
MKYVLILSILAALLGGCAYGPRGYGDNRDGYYQERGYYRNVGGYFRNDGYSRDYNYRRDSGNYGNPYWDHDR